MPSDNDETSSSQETLGEGVDTRPAIDKGESESSDTEEGLVAPRQRPRSHSTIEWSRGEGGASPFQQPSSLRRRRTPVTAAPKSSVAISPKQNPAQTQPIEPEATPAQQSAPENEVTAYPAMPAAPARRAIDQNKFYKGERSRLFAFGAFSDKQAVYNTVADLPFRDWYERIAVGMEWAGAATVAQWFVRGMNFFADHTLEVVFFVWGLLNISQVFLRLGEEQSIRQGGNATGPNVFYHEMVDSEKALALGVVFFQAAGFLWRQGRGLKQADNRPFLNFIEQLADEYQFPTLAMSDEELRRILVDPRTPEEVDTCLSWYSGFIGFLVTVVPGGWGAVGYLMQNIYRHFSFQYEDSEITRFQVVPKDASSSESEAAGVTASVRKAKEHAVNDIRSQHTDYKPGEERLANHALLATLILEGRTSGFETRRYHEVKKDLYNAPLCEQFLEMNPSERQRLRLEDASEIRMLPEEKAVSRQDIAARLVDFTNRKRMHRFGLLAHEGNTKAMVTILYDLLVSLTDIEIGDAHHLPGHCLLIVNIMRPGIHHGQWKNPLYFYPHDPIVTNAFRRLSVEQQVLMIHVLLSGNDAGKILVLSILDDVCLTVSELAGFFRKYIISHKNVSHLSWLSNITRFSEIATIDRSLAMEIMRRLMNDTSDGTTIFMQPRQVSGKTLAVTKRAAQLHDGRPCVLSTAHRHDQSGGLSVFPTGVRRSDIVDVLLNVEFDEESRDFMAEEIYGFLIRAVSESAEAIPLGLNIKSKKHQNRPTILESYRSACEALNTLTESINAVFSQTLLPDALLSWLNDAYDSFDGGASEIPATITKIWEYKNSLEEAIQLKAAAEKNLKRLCRTEEMRRQYLQHCVKGYQSIGWRTMVLFAKSQHWDVMVYGEHDDVLSILLKHVPKHTLHDVGRDPISLLLCVEENGWDFAVIEDAQSSQIISAEAEASAELAETSGAAGHLQAAKLFWSISSDHTRNLLARDLCSAMPESIAQLIDVSHIGVIREALLEANSLEALAPWLLSVQENNRRDGYRVLSYLIRQKDISLVQPLLLRFIKAHFDEMRLRMPEYQEEMIAAIEGEFPKAMIIAALSCAIVDRVNHMPHADDRARFLLDTWTRFYPNDSFIDVLIILIPGLVDHAYKRRLFSLTLKYQLQRLVLSRRPLSVTLVELQELAGAEPKDLLIALVESLETSMAGFSLLVNLVQIVHRNEPIIERLERIVADEARYRSSLRLTVGSAIVLGLSETQNAYTAQAVQDTLNQFFDQTGIQPRVLIRLSLEFLKRAASISRRISTVGYYDGEVAWLQEKARENMFRILSRDDLVSQLKEADFDALRELLPLIVVDHLAQDSERHLNYVPGNENAPHNIVIDCLLALLFDRITGKTICQLVPDLQAICRRIPGPDLHDFDPLLRMGVLINALHNCSRVKALFGYRLDTIIFPRMQMLALRTLYQTRPGWINVQWLWLNADARRSDYIGACRQVLGGGRRTLTDDQEVENLFHKNGPLRQVFESIDEGTLCDAIQADLIADNAYLRQQLGVEENVNTTQNPVNRVITEVPANGSCADHQYQENAGSSECNEDAALLGAGVRFR